MSDALNAGCVRIFRRISGLENAYDVELDEEDVNRCTNVGDLVALVAAARNGSN